MFKRFTSLTTKLAAALALASIGFSAQAQNKVATYEPLPYVKVFGIASTNRYLIYGLEGEINGSTFISDDAWELHYSRLPEFVMFLDDNDVNNGEFVCSVICINSFNEVVGLNPVFYRARGYLDPL